MYRKPVIIDCDPGHDDMVAMVLAIGSKELDVKAVTCVPGNKPLEKVIKNALHVVDFIGSDCIVAGGANSALVNTTSETDISIAFHGESGLDGFEFPSDINTKASEKNAVEVMADVLRNSKEKVTIIATGPLTNIALMIRALPNLMDKIECISLMGGTCNFLFEKPFMEYNTYTDPEASKIVFESGLPIMMYGYDVTYTALYTNEFIDRVEAIGNETSKMVAALMRKFMTLHNSAFLDLGGCPVHDACAVAGVIDPSVVTDVRPMNVKIDTKSEYLYGATICDYDNRLKDAKKNANVVFKLDNDKFFDLIYESVKNLK